MPELNLREQAYLLWQQEMNWKDDMQMIGGYSTKQLDHWLAELRRTGLLVQKTQPVFLEQHTLHLRMMAGEHATPHEIQLYVNQVIGKE